MKNMNETGSKRLLVLGAGTAGTMVANKISQRLPDWSVTVVSRDDIHDYQPGYLFIPFGGNTPDQIRKTSSAFLDSSVNLVFGEIEKVDPEGRHVALTDGRSFGYDYLVIATGTAPRPDQTPGMIGPEWHLSVGEFYTFEGTNALARQMAAMTSGKLVVHICELPIKCPVAPLEFAFLADDFFTKKGVRDQIEITYVTPLDGAFTKPVASRELGNLLAQKNIHVEPDFMVESIDQERRVLASYDGREINYDQLVTVPVNMGADYIAASGLGDELNYVPVDKHTMQSTQYPTIFALGDAGNLPTSKAGSVAHFSIDVWTDNFVDLVEGRPMSESFDGHANCFVETGHGKALLLDFNYETEPLTGTFPLPKVGPLHLLRESRANHAGKLAFRHIYWHGLLPGRPLGLPAGMSMRGKEVPEATATAPEPTIPTF